jgi:hypothetical protein
VRRSSIYGIAALTGIVALEALLYAGVEPVRVFFTPMVWTCYIVAVDSAVAALTGRSQLTTNRAEMLCCAAASIPIWLVFEAYNLRLENWTYVGLPEAMIPRLIGYGWSFATILPALFETSDLLLAIAERARSRARSRAAASQERAPARAAPAPEETSTFGTRVSLFAFGAMCLFFPLVVPKFLAQYLFALVWVGFIFILHPVNSLAGRWSPFHEWAAGRKGRFLSLLAGGLVCGVLWEFWNYWAGGRWVYTFPIMQEHKLFEMPYAGFLGFPPFAVECFMMYDLVAALWGGGWGRGAARRPSANLHAQHGL